MRELFFVDFLALKVGGNPNGVLSQLVTGELHRARISRPMKN